ncbi:MAG: helix-turn-helix transcriptional regulator [Candidatus Omnitrophica bacterium]|nr:helix-turn-helix transcriptional regulator [Candidatus Omnitrophota bacterium]
MTPFSKKIKELRRRSGLTQIEFARRVGVGLRFVRDLEQGKPSVRLDKVNKVLKFLGHHLEIVSNHEPRTVSKSQD